MSLRRDRQGLPDRAEVIARLGDRLPTVRAFIARLDAIPWMANVGRPLDPAERVERVDSMDAARQASETSGVLTDIVWDCLRAVERAFGRSELVDAANALVTLEWDLERANPWYETSHLWAPMDTIISGAVRELMLADVVEIDHFRSGITWFERGHFRCGFTEDGRPIVW